MKEISSRPILRRIIPAKISLHVLFALVLAFIIPVRTVAQDYYPVHATVQVLPPYSLYLSDYSNGFRDRLVVTLYNRDLQQQTLDCRLRLRISNTSGFCIESRDEVPQRSITVEPNVPLRLTSQDIAPYLQTGNVKQTGTLRNGRLPEGMMTFSVQVVEQHTGRILSPWASGRAWLETKKPPMLVMPEKDETVAFTDPQHILFRWYPQHLGLSGVEYELHIRDMLDNCQNPAAQYDSGKKVFTTKTRQTLYNYSNIDPELIPGHTYAWKVRAVAMDGIDEVGVFDNDGYSETGWFRLVRGCDAPVIDRAEAGYRKLDLGWHGSADDMRYTVQYSTEKENGSYNWKDTTTIDNETTLYGLTPGATYSYRVGALCSATGKPVYSQIGTVQIPNRDSISAANCGIAPVYKELSKERKTDLKVGDRVTVGGDYTMLITELNSKGNGVYGGKGRLTFTWVFFVGLEVTFDDLVVNTDGYQIDGTVNTVYDGTNTNIANLDQLNDGGVSNRESRMSADGRSTVMDFSVPPMPRSDLSEDGGSVVVYDLSGAPHTIEIPSNGNGGQSIPFSLTDIDGNTWRFESCDSVVTDSLTGSQKTVHGIKMTKLDAVSGFSKDKLSDKVKARIAFMNGGQYAFDNLSGRYYSRSSKLGKDYLDKSGLGDGTYAPWKLVPMGKTDKVTAALKPEKTDIDISSVRFVDADGHDLESSYDSDNAVWTVSLTAAATEGNYYNVYAVAKPKDGKGSYQTIGKLFVVSYKTTKADIVLLPVEKHNGDISKLNAEISDIFAPCGVEISITESDALVGNTGWDLNGDGKLSLTNDAETDNVKRSAEMKALEDIVKSMPGYDKNALYLVYVPNGSKSADVDVEGNWGRGRQIGYVFENLDARTVAHEVGHAFTLQHTFEKQYGGNETRCKTENLMDYTNGIQLDAFQWEILAHNAPKIVASVADNAEDNWLAGITVISPDFRFITVPGTRSVYVEKAYSNEFKIGTLPGFVCLKNKKKYCYAWHDGDYKLWDEAKKQYVEVQEPVYKEIPPSVDQQFQLFYDFYKECGGKRYIEDVPYKDKGELIRIVQSYKDNHEEAETNLIRLIGSLERTHGKNLECPGAIAREEIMPEKCTDGEIAAFKKAVTKITDKTTPEEVAHLANLFCHDALCELSRDTLFFMIKRIAEVDSNKLTEGYELAIIKLVQAINRNDYSAFFNLLESDNNELSKKLVSGIHDVGAWGTGDNFATFIRLLRDMCKILYVQDSYWKERKASTELPVLNLDNDDFISKAYKYESSYDEKTGTITIKKYKKEYREYGNIPEEGGGSTYWVLDSILAKNLSPMTPVAICIESKLPLVDVALGEAEDITGCYIVPAIALHFINQKESNHNVEIAAAIVGDLITLGTATPVALASKVSWARRLFAGAELVGASGDILVNSGNFRGTKFEKVVNSYNIVMMCLGFTNLSKVGSGYKSSKTVNVERVTVDFEAADKACNDYLKKVENLKNSDDFKSLSAQAQHYVKRQESIIEEVKSKIARKAGKADDVVEDATKASTAKKVAETIKNSEKTKEIAKALEGHSEVRAFYDKLKPNTKIGRKKIDAFNSLFIENGNDIYLDMLDELILCKEEKFKSVRGIKSYNGEGFLGYILETSTMQEAWSKFTKVISEGKELDNAYDVFGEFPEFSKLESCLQKCEKSERVREFLRNVRNGRLFGNNIVGKIKAGGNLLEKLADVVKIPVKDLKQYQVFTEVPLIVNAEGGFMKADIVLLKIVDNEIEDVIIIENKLSQGTAFTPRQKEGFGAIISQGSVEMEVKYKVENQVYTLKKGQKLRVENCKICKINDRGNPNCVDEEIFVNQIKSVKK